MDFRRGMLLVAAIALAGCGSGGGAGDASGNGSGGSSPSGFGATMQSDTISGPLTPVQMAISTTLLQPVAAQLPSPLNGTVHCADQAVVVDVLDIGNALLNGASQAASNPGAAYATALSQINTSLEAAISNLALAINVAAGTNSGHVCVAGQFLPTNDLVAALPMLGQLYGTLVAQQGDPNLATLSSVIGQLDGILLNGLAQTPEQARAAPVLGGLITLLQHLATNLTPAASALLNYNASTGNSALETLVSQLLVDALTQVVPLSSIDPSGAAGSQVATSVNQIVAALGTVTGPLLTAVTTLANGGLAPVLNPIEQILAALVAKLPKG